MNLMPAEHPDRNRDGFDLTAIRINPRLNPLREEPRFHELLARVFPR
jgi:hypothetical protein